MGNNCCYNEKLKQIKADKSYHQRLAAHNRRGANKSVGRKIIDLELDVTNQKYKEDDVQQEKKEYQNI